MLRPILDAVLQPRSLLNRCPKPQSPMLHADTRTVPTCALVTRKKSNARLPFALQVLLRPQSRIHLRSSSRSLRLRPRQPRPRRLL